MPRLATTDTKDRFTRQVVKVHQSTKGAEISSFHRVFLYALDGSRIGSCDMLNDDDVIQYPE